MTQKLMANMLGVHRPGVTEATHNLQKDGLIKYGSGRVTVLDRPKLEDRACECYGVVRDEIERLFAYKLPIQLKPVG
jgi:DNA-binding transcriptional regulator YhcF (GntR family)